MQIPKDRILEMLRTDGDETTAGQADRDLPDEVDTERDHEALSKLGLDPKDLLQKIDGVGIPKLS